jgi:hypothetical protein
MGSDPLRKKFGIVGERYVEKLQGAFFFISPNIAIEFDYPGRTEFRKGKRRKKELIFFIKGGMNGITKIKRSIHFRSYSDFP